MTLRPFESLRVVPSTVEGRLASLAQGKARQAVVAACTVLFVGIGGNASLLACPMCFANVEETALVDGTKLGILTMLAIIVAVQAAFVGFFLYLRKQARMAAEVELDSEWSQLQRTSR